MTYNVVLVFRCIAKWFSYPEPLCWFINIYLFFFRFFSHLGYHRILSRVPCAIQEVLVDYLLYIYSSAAAAAKSLQSCPTL